MDDLLSEVEQNIQENSFTSLRNAARGLLDCAKSLMTGFAEYHTALIIIKDQPIRHRIRLLNRIEMD